MRSALPILLLLLAPALFACSDPSRPGTPGQVASGELAKPRPYFEPQPCLGKTLDARLMEGQHKPSIAAGLTVPNPSKGSSYRDPVYGSCIVRLTDHRNEPPNGFARNYYSRKQSFNADESLILIFARDGYWHLYDADDFKYVRQLDLGGGSTEPQWHPSNPDILYLLPNRTGLHMYRYDVRTDKRERIADFDAVEAVAGHPDANGITDIWPTAARVWTRWEGSPSMDARYWAFQVETKDEEPLGLITFDLAERRITGTYDISQVGRPDHISMSPKGNRAVASWDRDDADCPLLRKRGTLDKPCGLMSFSRDFSEGIGLVRKASHSDMAMDANDREVIVIANYDSGNVEMIDLETGEITPLWRIYINGASTALHISGKAYNKPGWVLVSTYWTKDPKNVKPWYENKLFAVELKKNPRIINIASIVTKTRTYFSEPHATVNRDFTRVLFNANWGSGKDDDIDAYLALIPPGAIPDSRPGSGAASRAKN